MRKIIIFLILLLLPFSVFAETKLKTETLSEVLESEGITFNHHDYKEDINKVNIYMFRGAGCGYCRNFLTFLESITDEYGKYFNLVAYEVWNDEANEVFMEEVKEFLGEKRDGVPFIIIGDQTFLGYNESYSEKIKDAIKDEYNAKKKYDVIKEMKKFHLDKETTFFGISICAIIGYIVYNELDKKNLKTMINEKEKVKNTTKNIKSNKKEVNKTKKGK